MRRGKGVAKELSEQQQQIAANAGTTQDAGGNPVNPYENSVKTITTVKTVEQFWEVYNFLVRPNLLPTTTDYHFFREGIKPTWEDPSNAKGGKWIVRLRKGLASRYWEEVILAMIGGQFPGVPDGEICGAVVSIRYSEDIVSVWNRTANDRETTERLRDAIKRVLQLPSHVHMEYKPHQTSLQDKSSFRNTQVWKPKSLSGGGGPGGSGGGPGGDGPGSGGRPDSRGREPRRTSSWGERDDRNKPKSRGDMEGRWR
mmetsp:Transcript_20068/g.22509  ORF Transcript_20068/g.22509 Transcript_20068/m.22509 type:complete len:256 (+) Transcript_20068:82-849(+)